MAGSGACGVPGPGDSGRGGSEPSAGRCTVVKQMLYSCACMKVEECGKRKEKTVRATKALQAVGEGGEGHKVRGWKSACMGGRAWAWVQERVHG